MILFCFMKIVGSITDKDSPQKSMWAASGFVHPCDHKAGIRLGTSLWETSSTVFIPAFLSGSTWLGTPQKGVKSLCSSLRWCLGKKQSGHPILAAPAWFSFLLLFCNKKRMGAGSVFILHMSTQSTQISNWFGCRIKLVRAKKLPCYLPWWFFCSYLFIKLFRNKCCWRCL